VKVVLSHDAEQDLAQIQAWWREHRRNAPDKFAEEFVRTLREIAQKALIRKVYSVRRGMVIRRWLMAETVKHVYFTVEDDIVIILRIWDSRRGVGPKLP
jgi:plasmid stabilization system protein ParE